MTNWLTCAFLISCLPFLGGQINAVPFTHAHNDYLHENPLQDALEHGFISVEADILMGNGELYVGHDRIDLRNKPLMNFQATYLEPLYQRFRSMNGSLYPGYGGKFYLWIDIKYQGGDVFMILKEMIQPYREMLYSANENERGKVMILISGDRPVDMLLADSSGYFHIDGRPADLQKNISSTSMPFISEHFNKICRLNANDSLDKEELGKLNNFVSQCRMQQKKVRLWATPENEILWSQLLQAKVDLINTDSLSKLSRFILKQ
ncbi:MAG: hypothetical protein HKN76_00545 [Saprospiraceae bacterium]|nr:hypothetical protein [Saprospiraceae bacterium]